HPPTLQQSPRIPVSRETRVPNDGRPTGAWSPNPACRAVVRRGTVPGGIRTEARVPVADGGRAFRRRGLRVGLLVRPRERPSLPEPASLRASAAPDADLEHLRALRTVELRGDGP